MLSECPLCNLESRMIGENSGRSMLHCPNCDLLHVPRDQHLPLEQQRARYLHHENSMENTEYVRRFEQLIDRLDKYVPAPRRVLDYGCGPGPVLIELLKRRGDEAIGYDPHFAPKMDLTRPFDAVVSTETFEHFADPSMEMSRICDILRPGGVLAIMTQLHAGAESVLDWWYARDPTHVCFYSRKTMEWTARVFGMKLLECDDVRLCYMARAD